MEETVRANLILDKFNTKYGKLKTYCSYCHRSGHIKTNCKLSTKHALYKQSNIPEKYWYGEDPVKTLLMNETIRGYCNRQKYNVAYRPPVDI